MELIDSGIEIDKYKLCILESKLGIRCKQTECF